MQKLTGWTTQPFIGCDKCKEEGKAIVSQASRYTISKVKGTSEWKTRYYCQHHADIIDPPEKRLERKKRKQLERAKKSHSDDKDREWYYVSGANKVF